MAAGRAPEMKPIQRVILLSILLVGFGLRLYPFEPKSLWLDEALEYLVASRPVGEVILADLDMTHDPPLLSLLLSLWMMGGKNDLYLRMLPIAFSTLTIAAVFALARRNFTPWVGILAASITAVAPRAVYYGQEINQYALTPFFAVGCIFAFELFLGRPSLKTVGGFVVSGVAAFFAHYQLALYVIALVVVGTVYVLMKHPWCVRWTWLGGLVLLAVVGVLLLQFYALPQKSRLSEDFAPARYTTWQINPLHEITEWGVQTVEIIRFLYWGHSPTDLKWLPCSLLVVGFIIGFSQSRSRRLSLYLLGGLWIGYIAAGVGFFVYAYRYLWHTFPLCTILVAAGTLLSLKSLWMPLRSLGILAAVLLLGLLVSRLPMVSGVPEEEVEQLAQVIAYVESQWQPGDGAYVYYAARPAFRVYAGATLAQNAVIESWIRTLPAEEKWARLWAVAAGRPRVWMLFSHVNGDEERLLVDGLTARCRRLDEIQKVKATGYLFDCGDAQ